MNGNINAINQGYSVHSYRVKKGGEQTLSARVGKVAFQALFWVGWVTLALLSVATVIPAVTVMAKRVCSHAKLEPTIQEIAQNRYGAVRKKTADFSPISLNAVSLCDESFEWEGGLSELAGDGREKRDYLMKLAKLIFMVRAERCPEDDVHEYMQGFRVKVDELIAHPTYQSNRKKVDHPLIRLLQDAAHALVADAPGMEPMQRLGKIVVGKIPGKISYVSLADRLKNSVKMHAEFRADGIAAKVVWALGHPHRSFSLFADTLGAADPLSYNSYELGNASIQIGSFHLGSKRVSLSQAPAFTCDRLIDAARDRGDKYIVQDIEEEKGPKGEKGRLEAKRAIADCSLDYSLGGARGKILHVHTPIDVHRGEKAQSFQLDSNLVGAIDKALNGNERAKAIAFASLKGLQEMTDQSKRGNEKVIYLNQSCKQNIDRGVVVNVATILFADAISGRELTEERVHQMIGMVLIRPGMVDDRAIIAHRLHPLLDLLRAMESSPGLISAVRAHFGSGAISFEPSVEV